MAEEKKIKDQAVEKLQKVKGEIEHLEVQLALGKAEAVDHFEKKKKELHDMVHAAKEEVTKLSASGKKSMEELKPELEDLQVQLALGKAESLDAYKKYEKDVKLAIHNFVHKAKKIYNDNAAEGEEKWDGFLAEMKEKTTEFQTQLDIFRVQMALGEAEFKQEFEEKKKEFVRDAKSIADKIDKNLESIEHSVEEFGDDLAHKFGELKDKFISWF
ncbi:MAG: hypothetical protein ACPGJS_06440 [Flammeovirgaceae bacterium]